MVTAARHRFQIWPMTDSDYSRASAALGHNLARRKKIKASLDFELRTVVMTEPMEEPEEEAEGWELPSWKELTAAKKILARYIHI